MRKIISHNPYTGEIRKTFDFLTNEQLTAKLNEAAEAFEIQKRRTVQERAQIIKRVGECMQERIKEIAETITYEMGKPIVQSEKEVQKSIYFCNYYAENYEPLLPQFVKTEAKKHCYVKYLPIGIVYNLVPFNYPFYLNFKGGLPSLLIGNCLFVRNADTCPMVGNIIEEIMEKAGFDNGEYQNAFTTYNQIDQVFQHPNVQGVCFTGSTLGGSAIASTAGKYLKKCVLELGGNDAFVMLDDGNMDIAVA